MLFSPKYLHVLNQVHVQCVQVLAASILKKKCVWRDTDMDIDIDIERVWHGNSTLGMANIFYNNH